jgi:hypothetical protein
MSIQILNELFRSLHGNITAIAEETNSIACNVASAVMPIISQLSYLQIGAGVVAISTMLAYWDLRTLDNAIQRDQMIEREDVIMIDPPLHNMEEIYRMIIHNAIQSIPIEDLEDVIAKASSLIHDHMNGIDKARILNAIRLIPKEERKDIIAKASPLMHDHMDGIDKTWILNAIKDAPAEERAERSTRALRQLTFDFPGEEFNPELIIEFLETPLNQPLESTCWGYNGA